jgi:hypothetical protein
MCSFEFIGVLPCSPHSSHILCPILIINTCTNNLFFFLFQDLAWPSFMSLDVITPNQKICYAEHAKKGALVALEYFLEVSQFLSFTLTF